MRLLILIIVLLIQRTRALLEGLQVRPPKARYGYVEENFVGAPKSLGPDDDLDSYWEKSGYHEGDIMVYNHDQRNGVLREEAR
jgi:hypothetical protein